KNKSLSNMSLKELQKFDNNISNDIFRVLSPLNSMKSKNSLGGSAPETVKKSIQYVIKKYL
ncbi:MAG: argininosuccinate lyase, partial [Alphaproteobacteria bacterium]|nr:argininosuccinate lyase [Alphaproteobacteria bacterium]